MAPSISKTASAFTYPFARSCGSQPLGPLPGWRQRKRHALAVVCPPRGSPHCLPSPPIVFLTPGESPQASVGGIWAELVRSRRAPRRSLVWQPRADNKRSGCRGTCFGFIPWLLFKAVSLRTLILYPGGRLRAWVGSWLFVPAAF